MCIIQYTFLQHTQHLNFVSLMFHFSTVPYAVYCFPLKERSYTSWFSSASLAKQCVRFGFFADQRGTLYRKHCIVCIDITLLVLLYNVVINSVYCNILQAQSILQQVKVYDTFLHKVQNTVLKSMQYIIPCSQTSDSSVRLNKLNA